MALDVPCSNRAKPLALGPHPGEPGLRLQEVEGLLDRREVLAPDGLPERVVAHRERDRDRFRGRERAILAHVAALLARVPDQGLPRLGVEPGTEPLDDPPVQLDAGQAQLPGRRAVVDGRRLAPLGVVVQVAELEVVAGPSPGGQGRDG